MSEPFVGEIRMTGFNFAPRGWALCNGQLLPIAQNQALFALLGTTYGGDGRVSFGLPDLRGRVPVHQGDGPLTSPYVMGQAGGTETVTLTTPQIPAHTHGLAGFNGSPTTNNPSGAFIATAQTPAGDGVNSFAPSTNAALSPASISASGGNQPHSNIQPYLCVNFVIALTGIFPSRN
jgi:microcystin-dependent protein